MRINDRRTRLLRTLAVTTLIAGAVYSSPSSVGASPTGAPAKWLCHPGMTNNPCETPLDTTVLQKGGGSTVFTPARAPEDQRRIDCFWVYPTVSNQITPNATQTAAPEVVSYAKYVMARFSSQCRIFAPLYRQATFPGTIAAAPLTYRIAYADVLTAWNTYLTHDNDGRGFVLLGHSQGSVLLRKLIRDQIDPNPTLRSRLIGAMVLGGNVEVPRGQTVGGDFANVPLCTGQGEAGCVVAFSTTDALPAAPGLFGNSSFDATAFTLGLPFGPKYEVACTDPAVLSGEPGAVGITVPTKRYAPGAIAGAIAASTLGYLPRAATTWVTPWERYVGSCVHAGANHLYYFHGVDGSLNPLGFPPGFATHIFDYNLGLDRLVSIVHQQSVTWLAGA